MIRRPLAPVALLCAAGILCGEFLHGPVPVLLGLALAPALAAFWWRAARVLLLPAVFLLTGWADAICHSTIRSPLDLRTIVGGNVVLAGIRGTLAAPPVEHFYTRAHSSAVIQADELCEDGRWQPVIGNIRAVVSASLPLEFIEGQKVEVWGALQQPPGPIAEGLFDARAFYAREEIFYQLETSSLADWHVRGASTRLPLSERFRRWAAKTLSLGLNPDDEASRLTRVLMLDWKTPMTPEVEEPFLRAGTYHIFAVDGLRIGLLCAILLGLLRLARLPQAFCGCLVVAVLWFYAGLTGWPASAVRASIMATIVIAGWALRRPGDLLNSLFAAALVILLMEPNQLFQPGFQLSFVVVLCIVVIVPPVQAAFKNWLFSGDPFLPETLRPRWPWWLYHAAIYTIDTAALSIAAWIGSIPLSAYYFHVFTPAGIIANCAVVPATALALVSGLGSLLTGGWCSGLTVLFNNASWALMQFIIWCSRWTAHWHWGNWNMASPPLSFSLFYYMALFGITTGFVYRSRWKWTAWAALGCLGAIWLAQVARAHRVARLHLLPLNGSPVVLSLTPEAGNVLVDCGGQVAAQETLKPFLCAQGINRLDSFGLAVARSEHCGGASIVGNNFSIASVFIARAPSRSTIYHHNLDLLQAVAPVKSLLDGAQAGGWTILHPAADRQFAQADDNSLVLRRECYGHSVLFLPALGRSGQDALIQRHPELRAEIIIAGLPARDEPLRDPLLELLHPRIIVVADSRFPATRRASPLLRARLARRPTVVLYCRDTGALALDFAPGGAVRIHHCEIDFSAGIP